MHTCKRRRYVVQKNRSIIISIKDKYTQSPPMLVMWWWWPYQLLSFLDRAKKVTKLHTNKKNYRQMSYIKCTHMS